jgi:hypothetical protein
MKHTRLVSRLALGALLALAACGEPTAHDAIELSTQQSPLRWEESASVTAWREGFEHVGRNVALSGEWLAVSAVKTHTHTLLYERTAAGYVLRQQFRVHAAWWDGTALALDGATLAVGGSTREWGGPTGVLLFTRDASGTWVPPG